MKTITLSMNDFKNEVTKFSTENYVICDKWGICYKTIFYSKADATYFYEREELSLPNYFICKINWNN